MATDPKISRIELMRSPDYALSFYFTDRDGVANVFWIPKTARRSQIAKALRQFADDLEKLDV